VFHTFFTITQNIKVRIKTRSPFLRTISFSRKFSHPFFLNLCVYVPKYSCTTPRTHARCVTHNRPHSTPPNTPTHTCTHTHIQTHAYTRPHTHTCTCPSNARTHTYTYTHTQTAARRSAIATWDTHHNVGVNSDGGAPKELFSDNDPATTIKVPDSLFSLARFQLDIHICTQTYIYVSMYIHVHLCQHIHIYIYIYTYVCT